MFDVDIRSSGVDIEFGAVEGICRDTLPLFSGQ
jgi:hypothetical protein